MMSTQPVQDRPLDVYSHGLRREALLDPSGRVLTREHPRLLPMRQVQLSGTTLEVALTPAVLVELVLTDPSEALPVDTAISGGSSAATGIVLSVQEARDGNGVLQPVAALVEVTSGTFTDGEVIDDGATFTASVANINSNLRPVLAYCYAANSSASIATLTVRQANTSSTNLVKLVLPANGGNSKFPVEWVGKVGDYFTVQSSASVVALEVSAAWFVEIV